MDIIGYEGRSVIGDGIFVEGDVSGIINFFNFGVG